MGDSGRIHERYSKGKLCEPRSRMRTEYRRKDANIKLTIFFEDKEPLEGFTAVCKSRRTNHIRLDRIVNDKGEKIPKEVPYSVLVESDTEIVVQHSRMDVSQAEMTLMSTIAY